MTILRRGLDRKAGDDEVRVSLVLVPISLTVLLTMIPPCSQTPPAVLRRALVVGCYDAKLQEQVVKEVTTVTETDIDTSDTHIFSLYGGADAAKVLAVTPRLKSMCPSTSVSPDVRVLTQSELLA